MKELTLNDWAAIATIAGTAITLLSVPFTRRVIGSLSSLIFFRMLKIDRILPAIAFRVGKAMGEFKAARREYEEEMREEERKVRDEKSRRV